MSDDWFTSKLAPEQENHPQEVEALKDYLYEKTTAAEAAQTITRQVVTSASPRNDLARLQVLLIDALVDQPVDSTSREEPLIFLLRAIEELEEPDFEVVEPAERPQAKLWKGFPYFANRWYDIGYRSGSWKMDAEKASRPQRDALRKEHVRRAEVEARLVSEGLAGIPIDWGYEVIEDSLKKDALLDFEVPAAAAWLRGCGKRFRQGAEEGEKTYALGGEAMSLERWSEWKARLLQVLNHSRVVQFAAVMALNAINAANGEQALGSGMM